MLASAALRIRLGHSPDPDDAFMFWALAEGRIDRRGFEFEHVLRDIQTLNEWALEGRLETTAISLHAYPFVQDRYVLLPHGASMGERYGPVVVAKQDGPTSLQGVTVAVPGELTTAFLALRLFDPTVKHVVVPFGLQAVSVVAAGVALAALGTAARDRGDRDGLPGFLALLATLGAALFLCGIVLGLLPGVLAGGCG